VFFSTGTDEHGSKVQEAAKKRGIPPKAHCDEMVERFTALWKKLNISYTRFIRTTEKKHKFVVRNLLTYLYERGDIYFDTYEGKYCIPEERFWTEKDLKDGKCPSCGRDVIDIAEKNYFFKLSKYKDWLLDQIKEHSDYIQPKTRKNEILGFLKKPLSDLCISRPKSRLDWGIEIPFDKKYVTYVWFDALINYISTIGVYRDNNSFQKWWPCDIHLVGKDILTTHSVYWSIMLKSAGFELPKSIFAHGWWLLQDAKMSKSLGNIVRPIDLIDLYGAACFRYVLIKNMVLGADANFSEGLMIDTINSDLANDYGNLLNRLITMLEKYFDGVIPEASKISHADKKIIEASKTMVRKVQEGILKFELNNAMNSMLSYIRMINKYIDETAPWKLARKGKLEELGNILYTACEGFRIVTTLLSPVIIDKAEEALSVFSEKVMQCINDVNRDEDVIKWGYLKPGTRIQRIENLFPRIDRKAKTKEIKVASEKKIKEIDIDDFKKLDIRAGKIRKAEMVKGSKKLIKLVVDIGDEKRQIVAGIAEQYTKEEIVGKEIVIVTNLKPVKIMGVESNGMLLAASDGKKLSLVSMDREVTPGCKIS
jgi:methionyl-tRNA synthetase